MRLIASALALLVSSVYAEVPCTVIESKPYTRYFNTTSLDCTKTYACNLSGYGAPSALFYNNIANIKTNV